MFDLVFDGIICEADGGWPAECPHCLALLRKAGLTAPGLGNTIEGMKENVPKDVEEMKEVMASMRKQLKRKRHWGAEETIVEVATVKEEPGVKKEEGEEEKPKVASKKEELMSKEDLMKLHGLVGLSKDESTKSYPVECKLCATVFSGRNRAKVWQHVSGAEHRRRWKLHLPKGAEEVKVEKDSKDLVLGKCLGLRLNSSIGRKTRIGSDLREVWDEYVKYAQLDRSCGFTHEKNSAYSV